MKNMKLLISVILLYSCAVSMAQITYNLEESDQTDKGIIPAKISAMENGKVLWEAGMGRASALKIEPSPNGKYLAVLVGDQYSGMTFTAKYANSLYVIDGKSGKVLGHFNALASAPKWAEDVWQDLSVNWSGDKVGVKGDLFVGSTHPEHEAFSAEIPWNP